jgi:hypothetical protein
LRALHWPLFRRSAWNQPASVLADTTCEGATLTSVCSVGMGSGSHCGGGHDVSSLLWFLLDRSASDKPANLLADRSREGAALATVCSVGVGSNIHYGGGDDSPGPALVYVRLIGVGSAIHCDGGLDCLGHCCGLCSIRRIWLSQALWWRTLHVRMLLLPLLPTSVWAEPANMLAG